MLQDSSAANRHRTTFDDILLDVDSIRGIYWKKFPRERSVAFDLSGYFDHRLIRDASDYTMTRKSQVDSHLDYHFNESRRIHIRTKIAAHNALHGTTGAGTKSDLGIEILSLQEDVQQRIASDLHDSTCQHLLAASLNMMRMRRAVVDIGSAVTICDEIDESIGQALKEIRAFTYLLHPQNLRDDGLKSAIEQFVLGLSSRTSLETHLKITPAVDKLPYEIQCSVLRVVQEALANVFRHAKATQVNILIGETDSNFELRISDNGCGMPVSQTRFGLEAMSLGVGIPAMRARLDQMRGTFEIHSSSSAECSGTTVYATIPRAISRRGDKTPETRQGSSRLPKIKPQHAKRRIID